MGTQSIQKRTFLKTGLAAFAAARVLRVSDARAQAQPVPNSVGTDLPKTKAPANAADCHMHIYDPARFYMPPNTRIAPDHATVAEYKLLQKRNGTTRTVVVTPRNYATMNDVTLDAIKLLGNARGVAVIHPDVTDAELKRLNEGGIRGIRFSLGDPATAAVKPEMVEPLAKRVASLGWHLQFNMPGAMVVDMQSVLNGVPTQMVFDHLGTPGPDGVNHPSHAVIRRLVDARRAWVKVSGAYSNSRMGPPYPEATVIAQTFIKAAPERLVWGSDWPHPSEANDKKPNDAFLFDLLAVWAPDETVRHRILVENPESLYGFARL
jgi:predicted TIM-barrel fold metal-dependent hydrolase